MAPVLRLLGGVRWRGAPVVGDRQQALLLALAEAGSQGASEERLAESVWNGDTPADPRKALHVVVSRVRKLTAADAIDRTSAGYRLALSRDDVDAWVVLDAVDAARRAAAAGEWSAARDAAERGLQVVADAATDDTADSSVCATARAAAEECVAIHALALSRLGEHETALPRLADAVARYPADERLRHALLRSTAAVSGAPAALAAYEAYRSDLADRLGSDPGPDMQRLHRELLVLDRPIRTGVTHDASTLLGRDGDLAALRELTKTGRVTTILGAGGLGKTRLARVLARQAEEPIVHFVELVGVTSADMLLPELAASLGVQDQASARALRSMRLGDLRTRVLEELAGPPTLLVLDNCEQIVDAVAGLVTLLVGTLPDLTVLTTSRAPLGITPERVYALPQLDANDAAALFAERARAARPDVLLDADVVDDLVARLDGLPLAIELAAARVRVMSAVEIRDRLDERFALLRGGARDAPERHQTLWAVIDWSWALLTPAQQRALRWLSVFPDGFALAGAEAALAAADGIDDPVDVIEQLVAQSLVALHDAHDDGTTRYRMLETVREFGREQLLAAGDLAAATRAFVDWAAAFCTRHITRLYGPDQVAAVHAMRREETNISNALATVIERRDPSPTARIGACLLSYWSISGELNRTYAAASAITDVLRGYDPPAAEHDAIRWILACEVTMTGLFQGLRDEAAAAQLTALGPGDDPWVRSLVSAALDLTEAVATGDVELVRQRLAEGCASSDRRAAIGALRWRIHFAENNGDLAGALADAEQLLAKCDPDADGPFLAADARATTAQLLLQSGRRSEAAVAARASLGPLSDLGSLEVVGQLRVVLVLAAIDEGDLDKARSLLGDLATYGNGFLHARAGGHLAAAAEVAFASGEVAEGLRILRRSVEARRSIALPDIATSIGFVEPWLLFGLASGTSAYAQYEPGGGRDLYDECLAMARRGMDVAATHVDVPVVGAAIFAIALWQLLTGERDATDAIDALALAAELGYSQSPPSMDLSRAVAHAERHAPGAFAAARAAYAGRPSAELLASARAYVAALPPALTR